MYFLTNLTEYQTITTLINTLPAERTSGDYISPLHIEEGKRCTQQEADNATRADKSIRTAESSAKTRTGPAIFIRRARQKQQNIIAVENFATLHAADEHEKEKSHCMTGVIHMRPFPPANMKD